MSLKPIICCKEYTIAYGANTIDDFREALSDPEFAVSLTPPANTDSGTVNLTTKAIMADWFRAVFKGTFYTYTYDTTIGWSYEKNIGTEYQKPDAGIPKSDLSQEVLDKINAGDELPEVGSGDASKLVGVNAAGEYALVDAKTARDYIGAQEEFTPVTWTTPMTASFEAQNDVVASVGGNSWVKVNNKAFTTEQLNGATLSFLGQTVTLSASDLTDMSSMGYNGTLVNVQGYGQIFFCAYAPSNPDIPDVGMYVLSNGAELVRWTTMDYSEHFTTNIIPVAIGNCEMEDGVSNLPTGVLYLQIEG